MKPFEATHITADEAEKIFPKQYYSKYAHHLKILEFEKQSTGKEKKKNQLKFIDRRKQRREMPIVDEKRTITINRNDDIDEIIQKNKQQLRRLSKYTSALQHKLKRGPQKKTDQIKSPMKQRDFLTEETLLKLKAVDDLEFEERIKEKHRLKERQENNSKCHFISRTKSNTQFDKNSIMKATQAYENKIKGIQNTSRVELDLNMLSSDLSFKDLRMSLNMKGNESILMNNSILLSNRLRVPNQNKLSNYKRSENKKASLKSQRNQQIKLSIGVGQTHSQNRNSANLFKLTERVRQQGDFLKKMNIYDELLYPKAAKQLALS